MTDERDTGARIKRLLDEKGWSTIDLERVSGVPQATISRITTGKIRDPRESTLVRLAEALDVSPVYLRHGGPERNFRNPASPGVPVAKWVSFPITNNRERLLEVLMTSTEKEVDPLPGRVGSPDTFALVVDGESMVDPRGPVSFPSGAYIYVDPARATPKPDDFVVAVIENRAVFRQYKVDSGRAFLNALNPVFPPYFENFTVLGLVVGMAMFRTF